MPFWDTPITRCNYRNEPNAPMQARTGLWDPWVRNYPGPPGPQFDAEDRKDLHWFAVGLHPGLVVAVRRRML